MKVVLIAPPGRGGDELIVVPPLGLMYIAGALERAGHEVEIMDAFAEGLSWSGFGERIKGLGADVVGIGGMTPVWDLTRRAMEMMRPHAPTLIVGGPHATMRGPAILDDEPLADYAVLGEGEKSVVELVAAIDGGKPTAGIAGVVGREGGTSDSANTFKARPYARVLDDLPKPARSLIKADRYRYPLLGPGPASTLFTSRGCPHGCVFCDKAVFGARPRMHSAGRVLEEIEEIVRASAVDSVIIYDDLFTIDRDRVIEICGGIVERNIRFAWKCEGRVDSVDAEMLGWMSRAGCRVVAYGIETVSEAGLKFLNKGADPQQAANALQLTKQAGMDTLAYFLLGIPGERWDDAMETVRFAVRWPVTWAQFSVLAPAPGTPLWGLAKERGWYAEIDARNPLDKGLRRSALLDGYWTEKRLRDVLKAAHRSFYLRPSYIAGRVSKAGGLHELRGLWRAGMKLVKWFLRDEGRPA